MIISLFSFFIPLYMKKRGNIYLFFLGVCVLAIGGYFYTQKFNRVIAPVENMTKQSQEEVINGLEIKNASENPNNAETSSSSKETVNPSVNNLSQGVFDSGEEDMGPDILVVQVSYDGAKFTPALINIKVGDIVIFKNNSQEDFWPASNPHPNHTDYPEFNARQPVSPGSKYQFKFIKTGKWGYHNHLNPSSVGVINVTN